MLHIVLTSFLMVNITESHVFIAKRSVKLLFVFRLDVGVQLEVSWFVFSPEDSLPFEGLLTSVLVNH